MTKPDPRRPIAKVLVIKLGALGDFVLAMAAMKKIREAHPQARITLLTTPPFEALAKASPYFDVVETDGRARGLAWWALVRRLRRARYDRIYDLQTSVGSNRLFHALRPFPPAWSGNARGAALAQSDPGREVMHTLERQADQLKIAGIWPDAPTAPDTAPAPDLSWLLSKTGEVALPLLPADQPLALLVPGGSAHRPEKRWPVSRYAALAAELVAGGWVVAVVGGPAEAELAAAIGERARIIDLTGQTDFLQLGLIASGAALAVGNDTGPTHLIAAAGAPTIALFSRDSDPALCRPRGRVTVLRRDDLADLTLEAVLKAARAAAGTP